MAWGDNVAAHIQTEFAKYGLTSAQSVEFISCLTATKEAVAEASNTTTRTHAKILARNDQVKLFRKQAMKTVSVVRGFSGLTNELLADLNIAIMPATRPSKPAPGFAPVVEKVRVEGHEVTVRIHGPGAGRARPEDVIGASIFSYVGPTAPTTAADYVFEGNTNQQLVTVTFPESVAPGSTVYIAAFYYNAKSENGPLSDPLPVTIQFGVTGASSEMLKKAA